MKNFLQPVKDQYENYPYPQRVPSEELQRLWSTYGCHLPSMNYYCFGGKETFQNGFRVLRLRKVLTLVRFLFSSTAAD